MFPFVPWSGSWLLATRCTAKQNPAGSFCVVLSPSWAYQTVLRCYSRGFHGQFFLEVGGQVLPRSLSYSGSSAETCPPWVTLLVFEIPVAQLAASQQHAAATVWQPTQTDGVVPWPGNEPRPQWWAHRILTTRPPGLANVPLHRVPGLSQHGWELCVRHAPKKKKKLPLTFYLLYI